MINENQYTLLKQFAKNLIDADKMHGKVIRYEDLDSYINRAVQLLQIECDKETINRLFVDLEYEYAIVHDRGHVIFNDYGYYFSNNSVRNEKESWNRLWFYYYWFVFRLFANVLFQD